MTGQFPNDETNGKPRTIVHIWSARLQTGNCVKLTSRTTDLLRDLSPEMDGFIEGEVFEADDATSVTVVTVWRSRHAWAHALWNDRVGKLLQHVERDAKIFDAVSYPVASFGRTKN